MAKISLTLLFVVFSAPSSWGQSSLTLTATSSNLTSAVANSNISATRAPLPKPVTPRLTFVGTYPQITISTPSTDPLDNSPVLSPFQNSVMPPSLPTTSLEIVASNTMEPGPVPLPTGIAFSTDPVTNSQSTTESVLIPTLTSKGSVLSTDLVTDRQPITTPTLVLTLTSAGSEQKITLTDPRTSQGNGTVGSNPTSLRSQSRGVTTYQSREVFRTCWKYGWILGLFLQEMVITV